MNKKILLPILTTLLLTGTLFAQGQPTALCSLDSNGNLLCGSGYTNAANAVNGGALAGATQASTASLILGLVIVVLIILAVLYIIAVKIVLPFLK